MTRLTLNDDQELHIMRFLPMPETKRSLDAPDRTRKTFMINLLFNNLRFEGRIALAVASAGIVATLLARNV